MHVCGYCWKLLINGYAFKYTGTCALVGVGFVWSLYENRRKLRAKTARSKVENCRMPVIFAACKSRSRIYDNFTVVFERLLRSTSERRLHGAEGNLKNCSFNFKSPAGLILLFGRSGLTKNSKISPITCASRRRLPAFHCSLV
ncbi:hypothetical protein T4E_4167 [Trichinella pseudospiralis]|uniref:Uncharacterized protein n=1 Tax=Trichinella pseudospiralis TaxID=6337 RepID=A0A0V0XLJ8_TRIPS|nr:hypothetical protein T4E_4167 [Trichinella pseudospiralis]KRY85576.1 hypothetical protein T4D_5267 [Trichinella pseudospiralis]